MLEEMIVFLFEKRKSILGAIIGFVMAILLLEYGVLKTIFIFVMTYCGYKINDMKLISKIKKKIIERLQD